MPFSEPPVRFIEPDADDPRAPSAGIALCLSGGGYRAMLFHLSALKRLNEIAYLPKLRRVSSVSGGSITAGVLARTTSASRCRTAEPPTSTTK
jgi:NTE family protein